VFFSPLEPPRVWQLRLHQGRTVESIGESPRDLVECPWLPSSRSRTVKTLREFLEERAEIDRNQADEKKAIQQEWIESVRRLIQQIKDWLIDSDPARLLEIDETSHELREIDVGVYTAPGLLIRYEAREVRLIPIARMVVGPDLSDGEIRMRRSFGRIDLTDGSEKFMLFRSQKDPSDEWMIVEDRTYVVRKFHRQSFDQAMQRLLG
jgi:hypothetical protein